MYEKQGFYSGQPLTASQLDAMEDGIIEAQGNAVNKPAEAPSETVVPTINTNNEVEYKELSSIGGGGSGSGTGLYKHSLALTVPTDEPGDENICGFTLISPESQPFTSSTIEEYFMNGLILSSMADFVNPATFAKVWIGDGYFSVFEFFSSESQEHTYTNLVDTVTPV